MNREKQKDALGWPLTINGMRDLISTISALCSLYRVDCDTKRIWKEKVQKLLMSERITMGKGLRLKVMAPNNSASRFTEPRVEERPRCDVNATHNVAIFITREKRDDSLAIQSLTVFRFRCQ